MSALDESQPKISRHLALLRKSNLLLDRRQGQWVFYRINPDLPHWALTSLDATQRGNAPFLEASRQQLQIMGDRPERSRNCC